MKLLLIAHEFPPAPSPQSLRWMYLAREQVALGHEVDVLTARLQDRGGGLGVPEGIRVHACFPGPVRGMLEFLQRRRNASEPSGHSSHTGMAFGVKAYGLNWKGRAVERLVDTVTRRTFPDIRGEWRRPAGRMLRSLLERLRPDVVVSSHEPATTIELGMIAKRAGYRWVVDLGDPVLAPYTPARWRKRALRLEHQACTLADAVVVTNEYAAALMHERHGIPRGKIQIITQGFDERLSIEGDGDAIAACDGPLELFYSGSLYAFRRIDQLLSAVRAVPEARLTIASLQCPQEIIATIDSMPGQVRHLGFIPHQQALRRQRQADVLVNLGNDDASQVPGKVFEYLGANRPILHICAQPARDETASAIARMKAGVSVEGEAQKIAEALRAFVRRKRAGEVFEVPRSAVEQYGWAALGLRYSTLLRQISA